MRWMWTTMGLPGSRARVRSPSWSWESTTEWLRRVLSGDPDVRATFVSPSTYRAAGEDVAIFDRWAPADAVRDACALLCAARGHVRGWRTPAAMSAARAGMPLVRMRLWPAWIRSRMRLDRARDCSSPLLDAGCTVGERHAARVCWRVGRSARGRRRLRCLGFEPRVGARVSGARGKRARMARAAAGTDLSLRPGLTTFAEAARITRADGESVPADRHAGHVVRRAGSARALRCPERRRAKHDRGECRRSSAVERGSNEPEPWSEHRARARTSRAAVVAGLRVRGFRPRVRGVVDLAAPGYGVTPW